MARKKKTAKKTSKKLKTTSKKAKKTGKPAKKAPAKASRRPKKVAAGKKKHATSKPPAKAAPTKRAAARASVGELYGAEGWREEELSATELAGAPGPDELGAKMDEAELGGEDESEW